MENQEQSNQPGLTQEQILAEIYENTKKTKNYIKWQLIITVAMVVLPLLAMLIALPMVLRSVGSVYGGGGIMEGIQ